MFGDLGKIMKLVGEMKRKMPELQEKLAATQYEADAGGGAVRATVNGKLQLADLRIDPSVLDGKVDAGMLEDLVKAAVSAAQEKAATAAAAAMKDLTGGMDLPGLSGLMQ